MTKLNFGNELIKEMADPIHEIDEQIEELRKEKEKLEKELANKPKNFTLKNIKEKRAKENELKGIQKAYEQAKQHRQQLLDRNTKSNVQKITDLVEEVKEKERNAKQANIDKIKKNIVEIYELYDDAKAYDEAINEDIKKLIQAARPFLSEKDLYPGGLSTAQDRLSLLEGSPNLHHGMKIIDFFKQGDYLIDGLVPPSNDLYRLKLDE